MADTTDIPERADAAPTRISPLFFLIPALLCAGFLALHVSVVGWVEIDDAYITFRYARNIARGAGPVFNPGEHVEGISNILWAFALAPVSAAGGDLLWWARAINFALALACAAALAAMIHRATGSRALAAVAGALPASHLGYALWCLPGLETIFYSALLLAVAFALARLAEGDSRGTLLFGAGVAALVPAVRPEAGFVAMGMIVVALPAFFAARRARPALIVLAALIAGGAALVAMRWLYYGDLLPNTFYSKVNPKWAAGTKFAYLRNILRWHCWSLPLAAVGARVVYADVAAAMRNRAPLPAFAVAGLAAAGAVLFDLAFIWKVGMDWMPGWRYFVPVLPFVALLAAIGLHRAAGLALRGERARWASVAAACGALAVAAAQLATLSPGDVEAAIHQRVWTRETRLAARALAPRIPAGSLLAVAAAGTIPYALPDARVLDMLGLNDRHIAKHGHAADPVRWEKTDEDYILARKPDFIVIPHRTDPATGEETPIPALCWPGVYRHPEFARNYELAFRFDKIGEKPLAEPFWVFQRKRGEAER